MIICVGNSLLGGVINCRGSAFRASGLQRFRACGEVAYTRLEKF